MSIDDEYYMRVAIAKAREGLGLVGNARPPVGCVLVNNGRIIAAARTGDGGAPHAEVAALQKAGNQANGATAYVTLEPCAHYGRTPPCVKALVEAGIQRCVIACHDPYSEVNGRGFQILKDAGIEVELGVLESKARENLLGFFYAVQEKRPFITLKLAVSQDWKIAGKGGARRQITGALAQRHTHFLRSQHEAILVGSGTARSDKPLLTTRLPGIRHDSLRIILGKKILLGPNEEEIASDPHDLNAVMAMLVQRGVTRLLVEGGAKVIQSFLKAGLWDHFYLYRAPLTIGTDGLNAFPEADFEAIQHRYGLEKESMRNLNEDLLEIYTKTP